MNMKQWQNENGKQHAELTSKRLIPIPLFRHTVRKVHVRSEIGPRATKIEGIFTASEQDIRPNICVGNFR